MILFVNCYWWGRVQVKNEKHDNIPLKFNNIVIQMILYVLDNLSGLISFSNISWLYCFLVVITVDQSFEEDKRSTSSDESEAESDIDDFEKRLQSVTIVRDVVGLGMHARFLISDLIVIILLKLRENP